MASNTTQRQAQSILLGGKVKEYATWSLIVTCRPCGSPRTVPLADLPPELTIMQAMMRMRCRTCSGRIEAATLDNNVPGWRSRVVQVWGPGSYG
jgi:hypothetical protein